MSKTSQKHLRQEHIKFWHNHLEAQRLSGISVRVYAGQHGLAASTFYEWRKRLLAMGEALQSEDVRAEPLFQSFKIERSAETTSACQIRLNNGVVIE
ncbi:hypothetical protein Mmc1_2649 [Magnetococcus marinus MC-1]|uniref:Uncharacterized protein n=1 Tax=Magnetococcus marinus (strain ATCC BAA-1437 / JCM 17883 / MC-1) TaxID=156889 RepID=A0LB02_MAGMM|nr:hypothetical protein [Magnetococcus marinus]ABK45145.1 hypothetical protein Mmc1_2649 [Magnetococcus marinus MC-1]